jgi:tRNA-binding EMAP/Myf-like protein
MRGVKSFGMLMAASDSKHENVELLFPPDEANPGERIFALDLKRKRTINLLLSHRIRHVRDIF